MLFRYDWPNNWNNLFPELFNLMNKNNDDTLICSLHTLSLLFELLPTSYINDVIDNLLPSLSSLLLSDV